MKKTFDKYKQNLKYDENFVYSYNTKVAEIKNDTLVELGRWSMTTDKHVRYASNELQLHLQSHMR